MTPIIAPSPPPSPSGTRRPTTKPSMISDRWDKVFTLDNRLILRRLGRLPQPNADSIEQNLRRYLL
jgi:hypothetical protein